MSKTQAGGLGSRESALQASGGLKGRHSSAQGNALGFQESLMKQLLISLATPIFFLFIFLEIWLAKRRNLPCYRLSDALTDLGCGVGSQISVFYCQKWLQATYTHLYEHY